LSASQIRCTVAGLTPCAFAIERQLQGVSPGGVACNVASIISATFSGTTCGLRPRPARTLVKPSGHSDKTAATVPSARTFGDPASRERGRGTVRGMRAIRVIESEAALREVIGEPTDLVRAKLADRLNELTRKFVERSPFVCVATGRPDGGVDVSPRGDPPGFVRVLDDRTLLLPERPGNRLADTLTNLLADPRIALLFLIPGVGDTFRVNGSAVITDDRELLAGSAVENKVPRLGIVVSVEEAYTQCAKALIRSQLWNPAHHIERAELPSHGEILKSLSLPGLDVDEHEQARADRYARREGFY